MESRLKVAIVFRRLGFLCALLAAFSLAGGHWAALQTVAKATMLYRYAQRDGCLTVAAEETFDGQHPCELCRQIAAAKSREQKETPAAPGLKQDAKAKAVLTETTIPPAPRSAMEVPFPRTAARLGPLHTDQPPTPPPRRADSAA